MKSTQGASTVLNTFYLTRYGYRGIPYIAQKIFFNPRKKTLRSKTKDDIFKISIFLKFYCDEK